MNSIPKIELGRNKSESNFLSVRSKSKTTIQLPKTNQFNRKNSLNTYHPLSARQTEFNIEEAKNYTADDIINILNSYFKKYDSTIKQFITQCSLDKIHPNLIFSLKELELAFDTFISSILSMKKGNTRSPSALTSRTVSSLHTNRSLNSSNQQKQVISATIRKYCSNISTAWGQLYFQLNFAIKTGDPPLFSLFCNLLSDLLKALSSLHEATTNIIPCLVNSQSHYEKLIEYIKLLRRTCQLYSISLEKSGPFLVELGVKFSEISNGINHYMNITTVKFSMHSSELLARKSQCAVILADLSKIMDSILCFNEVGINCKKTALNTTVVFKQALNLINLNFNPSFDAEEEIEIMKNAENEKRQQQELLEQEQHSRSSSSSITLPPQLQQEREDFEKLQKQISQKHVKIVMDESSLSPTTSSILVSTAASLKPKKKKKNHLRRRANSSLVNVKQRATEKGIPELIVIGNKNF